MSGTPYTLQILHGSDFEASQLAASGAARNFAAIVDRLEDTVPNSITLSSGDNFIPGPFNASESDPAIRPALQAAYASILGVPVASLSGLREDIARVDIAILNAVGVQASAVGNHDFDFGPVPLGNAANLIKAAGDAPATVSSIGAQFPYLSSNLNFAGEPTLAGRFTSELRDAASYALTAATLNDPAALNTAAAADRTFAPWTIVTENGEPIGVIGVTTQLEASLTTLGGVTVQDPAGDGGVDNTTELAGIIQGYADQIAAQGVDKIVVVSHLQQYQNELDLATKLRGVDVIVAGGSHEVFANPSNPARPNQVVAQTYPQIRTGADGNPVAVVNVGPEYAYVGRLVVSFDAQGVIEPASIDPTVSGDYATTDAYVQNLYAGADPYADGTRGGIVNGLTTAIGQVIAAKDGSFFGFTDVYLEGRRNAVRTQETNLGDLSADANLFAGKQFDPAVAVSFKNGGGIRAEIGAYGPGVTAPPIPPIANPAAGKPAGGVSQLDIENSLRFNNALSVVSVTAANLARVFEFSAALSNPGQTPGGYDQVGGVAYSFDPARTAQALDASGNVTRAGERVRSLAILNADGSVADTVVQDGAVAGDPDRPIRVVTLSFIADGGDASPLPFYTIAGSRTDLLDNPALPAGSATFAAKGSEQDALAEYVRAAFGTRITAYAQPETDASGDARIQNLALRADTVLQRLQTGGDAGSDRIIGGSGNDTFLATEGRDTLSGLGGTDVVRFSLGRGAGKVLSELASTPLNGFGWVGSTGYNQTRFDTMERVEFTDGRIDFDTGSAAITVQRLYAGLLGRQAEVVGTSFFTPAVGPGRSLAVAAQIAGSAEGQARLGALTNEAFVAQLYTGVLGRAGEAGGTAFWTGRLAAGDSRSEVASWFADDFEARSDATGIASRGVIVQEIPATTVAADYRAVLNRDVDADGLRIFASQLATGTSNLAVLRTLAQSAEFTQVTAGLDDASFVRSLYGSALGRPADAGSAFWTDALSSGASRAEVAAGIAISPEAQQQALSLYDTGIRVG